MLRHCVVMQFTVRIILMGPPNITLRHQAPGLDSVPLFVLRVLLPVHQHDLDEGGKLARRWLGP